LYQQKLNATGLMIMRAECRQYTCQSAKILLTIKPPNQGPKCECLVFITSKKI